MLYLLKQDDKGAQVEKKYIVNPEGHAMETTFIYQPEGRVTQLEDMEFFENGSILRREDMGWKTATFMRNPDGRESLTVCDRDEYLAMENASEMEFTQNAICAVKSKYGEWLFGER